MTTITNDPVRVNDALTLDFVHSKAWTESSQQVATHHYAFKVSEEKFDEIFSRILAEGIPYGSEPYSRPDTKINHGGRDVYFDDPDGHVLELLTVE